MQRDTARGVSLQKQLMHCPIYSLHGAKRKPDKAWPVFLAAMPIQLMSPKPKLAALLVRDRGDELIEAKVYLRPAERQ